MTTPHKIQVAILLACWVWLLWVARQEWREWREEMNPLHIDMRRFLARRFGGAKWKW